MKTGIVHDHPDYGKIILKIKLDKVGTYVMGYEFERLKTSGMILNELVTFTPKED